MERIKSVHVVQGKLFATDDKNTVLTTVLGSCIATCLHDRVIKIGGMNHFLLPDAGSSSSPNVSFGVHAMELLINSLLKQGAQKQNLAAKVFGGANVLNNETTVGKRNAAFALEFLANEKIPCIAESLGGRNARRVRFWPASGHAQVKTVTNSNDLEARTMPQPAPRPAMDNIELF